jgi:hypothetical protein
LCALDFTAIHLYFSDALRGKREKKGREWDVAADRLFDLEEE